MPENVRKAHSRDTRGRDGSPSRPQKQTDVFIRAKPGRDGSPSRPQCRPQAQTDGPGDGRLGEASLPRRKWLGHSVPAWVDHGVFFVTINCQSRGANLLAVEPVAGTIRDASLFYHGTRWWIHLWLVMPDHLHTLLSFPKGESMVKVVSDWKRFVSRKTGMKWQKGFFDHRLRADESYEEKAHYIRMNPVREKLVANPNEWPYVWSFDGRDGSPSRPQGRPDGAGKDGPGRDGSPSRPQGRPDGVGKDGPGRDGSPSRPQSRQQSRPQEQADAPGSGRLGEASLPAEPVGSERARGEVT